MCDARRKFLIYTTLMSFLGLGACQSNSSSGPPPAPAVTSGISESLAAERAEAERLPYANDFGPTTIDVSSYPPALQEIYKNVLMVKCQTCHTMARTLNSQYVEPTGPKADEQTKIALWKKQHPEWFSDPQIRQIEGWQNGLPGIWEIYVKRMMALPDSQLTDKEGEEVWEFLRYDSEHRKVGAHAQEWAAERRKLLADFQKSHPDRYRELYETQ